MNSEKNKVVVYARVSTDQQEGGIDTQINACNEYIQRNNLTLARIFIDEAISGTTDNRKAFKELKLFIQTNEVDIVVFQPDRIARDITVWLDFVAICDKYNRKIHEVSVGEINTKTAVGQMTSKMRIVFAEFERNMFRERSKAGSMRNMKEGRWIFKPPFGYRTEGRGHTSRIVVDKSISPILREVLLDYSDEKITVPDAIKIFKRAGVKTSKPVLHRAVNNLFYGGYYEYPSWEISITKGIHEAIVPLSVIQKIRNRTTKRVKISKDEDFPLKSIMYCIECKRQLRTSKFKNRKFPYHYCKNNNCSMKNKYISPKLLDEAIIHTLKEVRLNKETKQMILYAVNLLLEDKQKIQDKKDDIIELSIKNNEDKMRLALMKIDTVTNVELVERFQNNYNECKKNILALEQELALSANSTVEPIKNNIKNIMEMLENPDEIYQKGDKTTKLAVVKLAFNNQITYDPIIKKLNLVFSDLIQEIHKNNTQKGKLEVMTKQKFNHFFNLLLENCV